MKIKQLAILSSLLLAMGSICALEDASGSSPSVQLPQSAQTRTWYNSGFIGSMLGYHVDSAPNTGPARDAGSWTSTLLEYFQPFPESGYVAVRNAASAAVPETDPSAAHFPAAPAEVVSQAPPVGYFGQSLGVPAVIVAVDNLATRAEVGLGGVMDRGETIIGGAVTRMEALPDKLDAKLDRLIDKADAKLDRLVDKIDDKAKGWGTAGLQSFGEAAKDAATSPTTEAFVRTTTRTAAKTFYSEFVKPTLTQGFFIGAGLITLWFSSRLAWQWIESHYNRPRLDFKVIRAPTTLGGSVHDKPLQVVFEPEVTQRLNSVCQMAALIKNKIKAGDSTTYRNLLLYGPPGSGKRMLAQGLAQYCQMDFYEITASAFIKFKDGDAARAIEEFFKKEVDTATQGAIVFIDNASMIFAKRKTSDASVRMVTAFIEQIQKRSDKYMVILSMNTKPTYTDETAVLIDDEIGISRPGLKERKKILDLYRDKFFLKAKGLTSELYRTAQEYLSDQKLEDIAIKLDNALPAELHSFMEALKLEASLPSEGAVTDEVINRIVSRFSERYQELISEKPQDAKS